MLAAVKARDMSYWAVKGKVRPSTIRFGETSLSTSLEFGDGGLGAYSQFASLS